MIYHIVTECRDSLKKPRKIENSSKAVNSYIMQIQSITQDQLSPLTCDRKQLSKLQNTFNIKEAVTLEHNQTR